MKTTLTKTWRLEIVSLVALNLLLGASPAASNVPTFTTIDVPGAGFTWTFQINAAGEIVGFYGDANNVLHRFLLRKPVLSFPLKARLPGASPDR